MLKLLIPTFIGMALLGPSSIVLADESADARLRREYLRFAELFWMSSVVKGNELIYHSDTLPLGNFTRRRAESKGSLVDEFTDPVLRKGAADWEAVGLCYSTAAQLRSNTSWSPREIDATVGKMIKSSDDKEQAAAFGKLLAGTFESR